MKFSSNRVLIILGLLILTGVGFSGRLLYLQAFGGEEYIRMAEEQRQATITIQPKRGTIYDRNQNPLAYSLKVNNLYINPSAIENPSQAAEELAKTLKLNADDLEKILTGNQTKLLKEEISPTERKKIEESTIKGLSVITEDKRFYTDGRLMPHILGFVNDEGHGVYGLEEAIDEQLFGNPGSSVLSVDPYGDVIPFDKGESQKAFEGSDVNLTVDVRIQELVSYYTVEAARQYRPKKISVIVMDPNSGDILGLANYPSYDSSKPREPFDDLQKERWQGLSDEKLVEEYYKNWTSFSTEEVYEPGSVFKFITAAAAYDLGLVNSSSTYTCDGIITDIEGVELKCHAYPNSHGVQTFVDAMDNSCNPAFIQMAQEIGPKKMYEYIQAFGFKEPTGYEIGLEASGLGPKSAADLTPPHLATISYGHGIAVTPIQMIRAISAVVNGGELYKPRIITQVSNQVTGKSTQYESKMLRQVLKSQTSEEMRYLMRHGVTDGTADGAYLDGYDIGGKTGTTTKFVEGEYSHDVTIGSYLGIYPSENPEFIILAVVDEAVEETSGNVVAAPLVRNIISGIIDIKADKPQFPEQIQDNQERDLDQEPIEVEEETSEEEDPLEGEQELLMPDLIGLSLGEAIDILAELGIEYSVSEEVEIIEDQWPSPGQPIEGQVVELYAY